MKVVSIARGAAYRNGKYYEGIWDFDSVAPSCFVQKADLKDEFFSDEGLFKQNFEELVKEFLEKPRVCDGFTPWIQGFHTKEHKQMLLNDEMLKVQRQQAEASLRTATMTARWTAAAVIIGAFVAWYSANLTAKATIEAVNIQITSDRELAKREEAKSAPQINMPPIVNVPPINVIVQIPPELLAGKKAEKK